MFKPFVNSAKIIARHPGILLPAIIVALVGAGVFIVSFDPIAEFLYDSFILGKLPGTSFALFPAYFIQIYLSELAILGAVGFVVFVMGVWLTFAMAKFGVGLREGSASVKRAMAYATRNLQHAIVLGIFLALMFALYGIISFVFMNIAISADIIGLLGVALLAAWFIIGLVVFFRLVFLPVVMSVEGLNTKKGIISTWKFTKKRFWEVIAFVVVLSILTNVIINIGTSLTDYIPEDGSGIGDTVSFLVIALFFVFVFAYSNLAMVEYYLNNRGS